VQPRIYFRPDNGDAAFIEAITCTAPFDAVILPARYLALYPADGPQGDPDALPDALTGQHLQFIVDPGTAELTMPSFLMRASRRHRQSPIASACPLPLQLAYLHDVGARGHFLDVVLSTQTRAAGLVPPYLELQARDTGQLELNLQLLEQTALAAAGKPVVVFLQCTPAAFRRGRPGAVAARYRQAGARHVVLRVRGLRNEQLDRTDFEHYLAAIDAFVKEEVELTVDCSGQTGPALVAGGARGFATGWLHFRSVAKRPFGSGGGGSEPGRYAVPGAFSEIVPPGVPLVDRPCPVPGCRAHEVRAGTLELRLHFFHLLRHEVNLAASLGPARYAERLRAAGGYAAGWGVALFERARRAA
jgi:hypothetical protein